MKEGIVFGADRLQTSRMIVVADTGCSKTRLERRRGRVQHVLRLPLPVEPHQNRLARNERSERPIELALLDDMIDEIVAAPNQNRENAAVTESSRTNLALSPMEEGDAAA